MKKKIYSGWLVVIGAVLLQLCIGAIYSWSLFNEPLIVKFGWDKTAVVLTYSISIFAFAFSTIFSGRLQDRLGPRIVAAIGGLLYGGGLALSSTATSIIQLYIYYGLIAGAGVGFVYVCPISTCVKWFPDRKGFITGIAVGAFGLGSLVFKSIIQALIAALGVSMTFLTLGTIYFILIEAGAQLLALPSEGHGVSGRSGNMDIMNNNFTAAEMLKTKVFYLIWTIYLFGTISGLLVIGHANDIGVNMAGLNPASAANAVSIIALFNAAGRLTWGILYDRLGRRKVIFSMFILTASGMIGLSVLTLNFLTFFLCLATIAFSFGGFLSVMPTLTGEFYGIANLGANYGFVYQAYGLAAIIGSVTAANIGEFKSTFILAAVLSLLGAVMTISVKKPVKAVP